MPKITTGRVIVAFDASTNRYGAVYHREGCRHLSNMYGSKVMPWEAASESGKRACLHCHKVSFRLILCPFCEKDGKPMVMLPLTAPDTVRIHFECPACGAHVHQQEETDG